MSTPESDAELWRDALEGDGESFARIFDRHAARIARHTLALVPRPDDVQDVVASTFLEAWRRRAQVRFVDDSLLPWLLVTATHSARNLSRSSRRYRDLLARIPTAAHAPDPADVVGELLADGEAATALSTLSRAHQDVVTLCILERLSLAEAASVLRVPVGTVKSRLFTAKRLMAARLQSAPPAPAFRPVPERTTP